MGRCRPGDEQTLLELTGTNLELPDPRDETIALTKEITGQKPDDPRPAWIFDNAIEEKAVDATIPLSVKRLEGMKALLQKAGALPKDVDVSKMVDLRLREEALAIADK